MYVIKGFSLDSQLFIYFQPVIIINAYFVEMGIELQYSVSTLTR